MKRKQNGVSIIHAVNDRANGVYVETDILARTITIRMGLKKRRFTLGEADRLEFLLKRQIDRLLGKYPKEAGSDQTEFLICPNCGKEEKSTANFCGYCGCELNGSKKEETEEEKFKRLMNNYLKSNRRVLFLTGTEGEEQEDVDSDANCTSGHS